MKPLTSAKTNNRNFQDSTQKQDEEFNSKRFSEEEKRLCQNVFSLNIKRKPYKKRSIKKVLEGLLKFYFPQTEVSYHGMRKTLISRFERCSRQTVLAYLGRPETKQVDKVDDCVIQQGGGMKLIPHEYVRKLPRKQGYLELFGFATLFNDDKTGKIWFKLHHTEQTKIDSPLRNPPYESFALNESSYGVGDEFREALAYAKEHELQIPSSKKFLSCNNPQNGVSKLPVKQAYTTCRTEKEEESITREKKFDIGESILSKEEKRLFGLYDSVTEASR